MDLEKPLTDIQLKPVGELGDVEKGVFQHYADSDPGLAELLIKRKQVFSIDLGNRNTTTDLLFAAATTYWSSDLRKQAEEHLRIRLNQSIVTEEIGQGMFKRARQTYYLTADRELETAEKNTISEPVWKIQNELVKQLKVTLQNIQGKR